MAEPSRRAAVLGRPIGHSLSPLLHATAYRALGLDWSFDAVECDTDGLAPVLAERRDWAGFACTMPLKRVALDIADEVSSLARAAGSANTLLPRVAGGWRADNTDVAGIVAALGEYGIGGDQVVPSAVTVLGAGGTAQALAAALPELGVTHLVALVRDVARTAELQRTAAAVGIELQCALLDVDSPHLQADLVVSTLPAHAADSFASTQWRPGQNLLDVSYDPWPTMLASAAAAHGVRVISGVLMLLHQAGVQVELMTGQPAPLAAMRTALRGARPCAGL